MISNFLSNRTNLSIVQFICLFIMGYIMGTYLTMGQFITMFVIIMILQMVTHIKAVADGMLYNEVMNKNKDFKKFINKLKKTSQENKDGRTNK